MFANHLADTDQFYHDPERGPYGENLAINSGSGGRATADNVLSREFNLYCCMKIGLLLLSFEILTRLYSSFTQDG